MGIGFFAAYFDITLNNVLIVKKLPFFGAQIMNKVQT